ncbi:MAG: helix-turn-helix domain-containing protein, partial [Flavobacteriales bacterium]|nr:helix-turn-helix domain-containing protein [Flavobacteriales bacterium]
NDVRITAQLVNVEDGFHYWSETYNHQLDDIFKVQDQISNKVAHKIREYLGHFNYEEEEFVREESAEAYEYFLKSRFNFNKFQKEDISLALEQIDLAIEAEPRNSRYYAAKGIYCGYMAIMNMVPFNEAFKLSKTAAEKALSIDSTDPEAHYSMLVVSFVFEWDISKAQHHGALALKYKPNYPDALFAGSLVEIVSQNYKNALDGVRKAVAIDPFSSSLKYYYAAALVRLEKLDEALAVIDESLEMAPANTNSYQLKGVILTRRGEYDEAISHYKKVPISPNETISYNAGLGIVYASLGNREKAIEYLNKIKDEDQKINVAYEENALVIINILLGDFDEAFRYLEQDIHEKKYYLKYYRVHPVFDLLKNDKRYSMIDTVFFTIGTKTKSKKKKYLKSGIKNRQVEEINKELLDFMQEEKPYLKANISLTYLAESLSKSANHLSQVINDRHKKNFFDFINDYRIEEMTALLRIPENKRLTLLAVAHDAGFNSKTTFNAAFKKLKSKTPSQYFKKLGLIG